MENQDRLTRQRLLFLDNVRTWMVLIVVVFHVALAYCSLPLWPIIDPPPIAVADWVFRLSDVFMMAILFFVAGYFAVPSIDRWGAMEFLKRKAVRLMVPWLLVTTLLNPISLFPWHYTNDFTLNLPRMSFWQYWLVFLKGGFHTHVGSLIVDGELVSHFSPFHCWFLAVLMVFFMVFAGWNHFFRRCASDAQAVVVASRRSIMAWLLWCTVAAAAAIAVITYIHPESSWLTIGPLLQFQTPNVVLYCVYFAMGVVAYRRRWFDGDQPLGSCAMWVSGCVLLCIPYLIGMDWMADHPSVLESPSFATLHWCYRVVLCLAFLGAFIAYAQRYANRPNTWNQHLAANSYKIYLLHMVVVIMLQWLFLLWVDGPTYVKFVTVSLLSIALSYVAAICIPKPSTLARLWSGRGTRASDRVELRATRES